LSADLIVSRGLSPLFAGSFLKDSRAMPTPKKTVARMLLDGNTSHLTKAQIAERVAVETETEAHIPSGRPKMPKTLSELERECWKGASKIMKARGTLTKGDAELLELFAVTKARWILARRDIEVRGLEIQETRHAKDGSEYEVSIANPSLKIADNCESRLLQYSKSLGLTAVDRTKVKAVQGTKKKRTMSPTSIGNKFPHLFEAKKKETPC
jgi:P27 family predicted phage terminase small subunit